MPAPKLGSSEFIEVARRLKFKHREIAHELHMDPNAVNQRLKRLRQEGLLEDTAVTPAVELRILKEKLRRAEEQLLTDEFVRSNIVKLVDSEPKVPKWTLEHKGKASDLTGVPTLFASDWHWGEVVRPSEIGGVNEYNLEVACRRAQNMTSVTCELLTQHLSSARYPGIVLILGGDMLSGDIHDELRETNEVPTMVAWLDLLGNLRQMIDTLLDTFGLVHIVGVTGNHGRNTNRPRAKRRNHSNFDWLLYQVLQRHYADRKGISFQIPDGSDTQFRLYGHRYMLTHGDQFRGGDGIIGALGPITRGDIKKRSRQSQLGQGYDTLLMGHWHQLIMLDSLIVNGSLKGYDEYAAQNNFKFESPRQALWITHPEHGITFSMPVYVDRRDKSKATDWVAVPKA